MAELPFYLASFLGAYLLFLVQPLIAKQVLPWFGGTPAVWSTCLVFFQLALVLGYGYAHITRRLGVRRQARWHVVLLAIVLTTLPITASPAWKPPDAGLPVWRLLGVLAATVGAPYSMLASTAPLVQDWYRRVVPGRSPYLLYALSNAGSLIALLSYPGLLERWLTGHTLAVGWSFGFVAFVLVVAWCGRLASRRILLAPELGLDSTSRPSSAAPPVADRVLWVALPACGSALLLAATNQLCQDVAVVPLLWVVPLALYLVTYIVSFAAWYSRVVWSTLFVVSVALAAYALQHADSASLILQGGAILALLFSGCMVCHGELARIAPAGDHLTAFYLALAAGGSVGGLFVGLAAPVLFTTYLELPLLVLAVFVLLVVLLARDALARSHVRGLAFVWSVPVIAMVVAFAVVARGPASNSIVAQSRNFYGVLTVADRVAAAGLTTRELMNGRVVHGAQFVNGRNRDQATTYYAPGSGVDLAIRRHPRRLEGLPLTVGVVGLGTGTIAAWGEAGDRFRFFEINPRDAEFASRYFTFLADSRASVEIVLGDARLSLEREVATGRTNGYDVLVLDAFSGDSIPVHLLTREAFTLYWQALRRDGVLAIHVSNLLVNLEPVVRALAAEHGLEPVRIERAADADSAASRSLWMLVTANRALEADLRPRARASADQSRAAVWTDDFSSLASVLR